MIPVLMSSSHLNDSPSSFSPRTSHSICFFRKASCWFSAMNSGRQTRPASVYNRNSLSRISRTTDTSGLISSFLRSFLIVFTKLAGSRWTPIHTPLTNTFVAGVAEWAFSSNDSKPHSSKNSITGADSEPTEIQAISAKFLTRPQACPSGVSAGHTIPQCVL